MAKIIRLDTSSRKPAPPTADPKKCQHRQATAYTAYRTVHCSFCGVQLDPFDVLVDMLKNYVPPNGGADEEQRFREEVSRRKPPENND